MNLLEILSRIGNDMGNWGDWAVVSSLGFMALSTLSMLFGKKISESPLETQEVQETQETQETGGGQGLLKKEAQREEPREKKEQTWGSRLFQGLSKTREDIWGRVQGLLGGDRLDEETLEQIEEILYSADMSAETIDELIEEMKKNYHCEEKDFKSFIKDFFAQKLAPYQEKAGEVFKFSGGDGKTKVMMIVGVNGAGKTTSIGKLATKLQSQGASVVVGACDTFRAAAIEQLEVWCERAGAILVKTKHGADPSGVAYETLNKALEIKADYCLLDTAGRLHTKANLMDELSKTKRVLSKLDQTAPHETLLVIDSITGQNAMRQAEEFHKYLDLSGLILTKCDGSSKAGNAISMVEMLKVPIVAIGVGEEVEDINDFETEAYLDALI